MSKARDKFKSKLRKKRQGPKQQKRRKPGRRCAMLPVCSAPNCDSTSAYIIRPRATSSMSPDYAGAFWAACDDCVRAMTIGAKASGIDCDVIAYRALAHMTG